MEISTYSDVAPLSAVLVRPEAPILVKTRLLIQRVVIGAKALLVRQGIGTARYDILGESVERRMW